MTVWQDLGFKSKWGKFFTLNMLTTRHGENYRFKTASNQNCEVEHTFENQCRLYKCENNDSNMILTEKIEMEEKSWGSKSKNRMRQTQWWHGSRSFAALHARDYTLHIQAFPHLNVSPSPYPNPSTLQAILPSFQKNFFCFYKIFFLMSLLNLLHYRVCFMFWFFGPDAYGTLALQPGLKPVSPALEGEVLPTGPSGKSLSLLLYEGSPIVLKRM